MPSLNNRVDHKSIQNFVYNALKIRRSHEKWLSCLAMPSLTDTGTRLFHLSERNRTFIFILWLAEYCGVYSFDPAQPFFSEPTQRSIDFNDIAHPTYSRQCMEDINNRWEWCRRPQIKGIDTNHLLRTMKGLTQGSAAGSTWHMIPSEAETVLGYHSLMKLLSFGFQHFSLPFDVIIHGSLASELVVLFDHISIGYTLQELDGRSVAGILETLYPGLMRRFHLRWRSSHSANMRASHDGNINHFYGDTNPPVGISLASIPTQPELGSEYAPKFVNFTIGILVQQILNYQSYDQTKGYEVKEEVQEDAKEEIEEAFHSRWPNYLIQAQESLETRDNIPSIEQINEILSIVQSTNFIEAIAAKSIASKWIDFQELVSCAHSVLKKVPAFANQLGGVHQEVRDTNNQKTSNSSAVLQSEQTALLKATGSSSSTDLPQNIKRETNQPGLSRASRKPRNLATSHAQTRIKKPSRPLRKARAQFRRIIHKFQ